jgi:dihydrofolate synthase/folylpolyglutamate synthase
VIVGALGAERARPLLASICRHAGEIHLVVPKEPRALGHAELEALVSADFRGMVKRAVVEELFPGGDVCAVGGPDDVVVVTGSIYLLGEVMARISA